MTETPGSFQTPSCQCPHCRHAIDRGSDSKGAQVLPTKGEFTICLYCATILVFDPDLTLRHPTPAEWHDVLRDPKYLAELQRVQRIIHAKNVLNRAANAKLN